MAQTSVLVESMQTPMNTHSTEMSALDDLVSAHPSPETTKPEVNNGSGSGTKDESVLSFRPEIETIHVRTLKAYTRKGGIDRLHRNTAEFGQKRLWSLQSCLRATKAQNIILVTNVYSANTIMAPSQNCDANARASIRI